MNALLLLTMLTASPDAGVAPTGAAMQALVAEVTRAKGLAMPTAPGAKPSEKPYYVSAFLNEAETYDVWANFGALGNRNHATAFSVATRVRVGSAKFDNTNYQDQGFGFMFGGDGRRRSMPAELDPDLLRYTLWLALDDAYKAGLETLSKKRAFLETTSVTEKLDDFSPAPVFLLDRPRVPLTVDTEKTATLVRKASAVFLANPVLQEGTAWYRAASKEQNFASTEGSRHRFGEEEAQLQLSVTAQATDGMELRLTQRFAGHDDRDLPSEGEVLDAAKKLSARMGELARAPIADEDYTGPVLFVDQAAALFFLSTIGEPLSNAREPLGTRQSGRMIDRLGKRVAAKFLTAVDDPTITTWNDGKRSVPLWGAFPVDDDGVQAQRVSLVEEGVLKRYYMSRSPTSKLKDTNGHARGEQGGVGNLFITTAAPVARAALKKRLLELAKDEDLDYGLMVEVADERVPRSGSDGVRLSSPVLVWKVYADGRETLVRGLSFKPASARMLKELDGLGDDAYLLNLEHRGQRTSVVAPAVLVKLMELTRTRQEFEKPPLLSRP